MKIQIEDMADIGRGAAFLGTGGGGDPHIGRLLCEQSWTPPKLIALDQSRRGNSCNNAGPRSQCLHGRDDGRAHRDDRETLRR